MSKIKTIFVCTDCGSDSTKWQGQCPSCHAWNTFKELKSPSSSKNQSSTAYSGLSSNGIRLLSDIGLEQKPRLPTQLTELDRVLGGGFFPGSVILLGGDPGAGKSTMLMQVMGNMAQHKSLYITGEESLDQLAGRAKRLNINVDNLIVAAETNVEKIAQFVQTQKPTLLFIDSIQVMQLPSADGSPGGVTQVKESAAFLTRLAKQTGTTTIFVGHITKEGSLAGPKVLEHMIDCFIMLESNTDARYRMLRSHKNRFGTVNELGVFLMTETGLKEVANPSAIFLSKSQEITSGSVITVLWEGTRPLLVEIQSLVDTQQANIPKRIAMGIESQRLVMQLAVLQKHGLIHLSDQDVFLNIVGGVRSNETSTDLAIHVATASSLRNQPLTSELIVFGEVGLSGEVRPVPNGELRIKEARKHGFRHAIVPFRNKPQKPVEGIEIYPIKNLSEALEISSSLLEETTA